MGKIRKEGSGAALAIQAREDTLYLIVVRQSF